MWVNWKRTWDQKTQILFLDLLPTRYVTLSKSPNLPEAHFPTNWKREQDFTDVLHFWNYDFGLLTVENSGSHSFCQVACSFFLNFLLAPSPFFSLLMQPMYFVHNIKLKEDHYWTEPLWHLHLYMARTTFGGGMESETLWVRQN